VWQFLSNNEKGATFELTAHYSPLDDAQFIAPKKYITLNQVNVNIAGAHDKLLIIRDVTHIIYLE
jgi:hypothetical protein